MRITQQLSVLAAGAKEEILRKLPPIDDEFQMQFFLSPFYEGGLREIAELARAGDSGARGIIKSLLSDHFADGGSLCDLPDALDAYVRDQLTGKLSRPRKGPSRLSNKSRDFWIFVAMWICEQRGLDPTRTAHKRTGAIESGSQLVVSILNEMGIRSVGVSRVEKIYGSNRARRPQKNRRIRRTRQA